MTATPEVTGVQDLIDRIRTEGVESAQEEANRILHDARSQAEALLGQAHREVQQTREAASKEIQAEKEAGVEAVRLAARNTVMDLKAKVAAVFERQVRRLVATAMEDQQFVRDLVLTLAGQASQRLIQQEAIAVFLSPPAQEAHVEGPGDERLRQLVLGASSEMLREGITLVPDAPAGHHGVRVRVQNSNLEIDLSDEAVARLMLLHMMPRFWSILQGVE